MMRSSFTASFLWIIIVSTKVFGYPFTLLPQFTMDRIIESKSIDQPVINHVSNDLTSYSEYDTRSNEVAKPVESWTKINQNPVSGIETTVGKRVELECSASGTPPPEILWFTGSGSNEQLVEYVRAITPNFYETDKEWKGIATINSKLVIDCVTPEDSGLIYCASVSATKVKISSPTVLVVNDERGNNNCSAESEPTITLYSPIRLSNIGSSIVLPCRASGKPTPHVSWIDNYNMPLSLSTNSRRRVLDNGDLLIEKLLWDDMGGYTCKAKSGHRQQSVTTFLYPLRPDNDMDQPIN